MFISWNISILSYFCRVLHKNKIVFDYDDDGEIGAGKRLLEVLRNNKNVNNMMVVVTRWYGGIKLGHSRFKIIKDVAVALLQRDHVLV